MTEEEHIARAMLLGMSYHHGNGEPFYYTAGEDGKPVRMIDADTLKPIPNHKDDGVDWRGMARFGKAKRLSWIS